MKPFEIITHQGKKIAVVDLSDTSPEQAIPLLREGQRKIALMPPKSVLLFTDARNAVFNKVSLAALKEFSKEITPNIKASASLGSDGLRAVALDIVVNLTGRNIKSCETRQEALDWLVSR